MSEESIKEMFAIGAHIGYSKSRRHASMAPYVVSVKNGNDIIDLDKTAEMLENATDFIKSVKDTGRTLLFVATKPESKELVKAPPLAV